jgi:hypothetical protein
MYDIIEGRTHEGRKYRMLNVHSRVPGDPHQPYSVRAINVIDIN